MSDVDEVHAAVLAAVVPEGLWRCDRAGSGWQSESSVGDEKPRRNAVSHVDLYCDRNCGAGTVRYHYHDVNDAGTEGLSAGR